jgi:diaminopimelate decarboxylase
METVTVVGRHCEAGDVLAADVALPADVRPGDFVAVPGTGAYNYSMASNYNMVGRPPVVAIRDGTARLLVRRETASDLLARDIGV